MSLLLKLLFCLPNGAYNLGFVAFLAILKPPIIKYQYLMECY